MTHPDRCPSCGADRPAGAPHGVCPRCLMRLGLDGAAAAPAPVGAGSTLDPTLGGAGGGALATLDASVGPLPRILLDDAEPADDPVVRRLSAGPIGPDGPPARLQLLGEIARGGMGAVLKGRDADLGRDLAVKVLLERHRGNPELIRRFVEEAQIAGQLQHPGIVPVHEFGTLGDRRPYFTMKLVKGRTLGEILNERADPAADRPRLLSIFEAVCQTVAYAHARGVIHRDLKPSNVMVGSFGEVQVMDWGLAKVLRRGGVVDDGAATPEPDRDASLVRTARSSSGADESRVGSVLGTPGYMAPEQARGELERVDERADVFGLGAILCEILTGAPAFAARSSAEALRLAGLGDLSEAFARLEVCGADPELIALAWDCLAAEREDRPRRAVAVAERMTTYLSGVQERLRRAELDRVQAEARAEEERKRRRLAVALAAAVVALVATVGGGYAWIDRQRAARVLAAARGINDALVRAAERQGRAVAPPGDPAAWREALAEVGRAEDLIRQQDPGPDLREKVRQTRAELDRGRLAALEAADRLRRDRALLARLAAIRGARADHGDVKGCDADYAAAFRDAGIDFDADEPERAGRWIAARSEPEEVVAFLDDWAAIRPTEASWRRLVAAVRLADRDPWRDALRARFGGKGREALEAVRKLADDDRTLAAQPPASLRVLALLLKSAGDRDAAARVLGIAWRQRPDDFWVNFDLATARTVEGGQPSEMYPRPEEAVRHFTAALAARPRSAPAHKNLGIALLAHGRTAEAVAMFREAVRLAPRDAWAHADLGFALMETGDFEEAVVETRRAIAIAPGFAEYHSNLGSALYRQHKVDEAIAEHREAVRLKPDNGVLRSNLGGSLAEQGKLEEALAELREAARLRPGFGQAHINLGVTLKRLGRSDEAIAEYREATRLEPGNAEARVDLGNALLERGRLDEAVAEVREAVRMKRDLARAHDLLGRALRARGKVADAAEAFREAIRLRPDLATFHVNLGALLCDLEHDYPAAEAEFREAIRLDPRDPRAHSNLGAALMRRGKLDESIAEHREAIRLEPGLAESHRNLGIALGDQRKFAEAVAALREAIRLRPDVGDANRYLGIALTELRRPDEALAAFREAVRLNPGDASARFDLAMTLADRGQADAAVAEFHEVLRLTPNDAKARTNLGAVLARRGKLDESIAEHREAIRLEPGLAESHRNLGIALGDQRKFAEAVAALREAIRLQPGLADAHDYLGMAMVELGRPDEAAAEYREAIRLAPGVARTRVSLGRALQMQGKPDEAVASFREAIRLNPGDASARFDLAMALNALGQVDGAIAEYREAIRLNPGYAEAHCNLGQLLKGQGRFREALDAYRRGHELGSRQPNWRYPSAEWVRVTERQVALEARLPAVLRGEDRPRDGAEGIAMADMAYQSGRHAASARIYAESFRADPKLAEAAGSTDRYSAACAAALAGCGRGKDDPPPDATARAALRKQALGWLKSDLVAHRRAIDAGSPSERADSARLLHHWQGDGDLAGVRDPAALEALPEAERDDWRAFWAEVDRLLKRVGSG